MIKIPDTLPVPKHPTMEIVDSTKLQSFQDCPRGFFFSYVLGLRPEGSNVHLDFGSAWHDAMEILLLEGYSQESVAKAYLYFLKTYREAFPDEITDDLRAPKNPEFAHKALQMYVKQYEMDNFEVLYTETAGMVPVSEDRKLVVKLDSIVRDLNTGEVNSLEHKTSGRNSQAWRDMWSMMLQVESYTHLLYSIFPEEEVGKVIINGSVFTKTKVWEGVRIPVHKSKLQMAAFLWNVNHWIDMIEWNYQQLAETKPDDAVMKAFPINCASCSKTRCRMGGICSAFPNPLRFAEDGISGYKVEFWDPLRRNVETSDNVILEKPDGSLEISADKSKLVITTPDEPKQKNDEEDFSMFAV